MLMRRPKQILVALGAGVLLAGGGAIVLAETSGSKSTAATVPAASTAHASTAAPTVQAVKATVQGKSEQILVDGKGLPLYTYTLDTPQQSHVSGVLARLWPPLVSGSPTEAGLPGTVSATPAANGRRVQYNGRFLYTFVNDTPDQVTGQDVQGFVVATPGLSNNSNGTAPAPVSPQSSGYAY
jgi:predicted lipoprotein with Yx(FWY)xxD motif